MGKQTFIKLDYEAIKSSYPLALERLVNWFGRREDIKQMVISEGKELSKEDIQLAVENIAAMVVQYDPRKLYDFFDDMDLIIYINGHPDTTDLFVYHNNKMGYSMSASSRIEAEQQAFMDAFKLLDEEIKAAKQ